MFVDEVKLNILAGHGGRGCVSFRREKFEALGGPDGGDGGRGGDVIFVASQHVNTLVDFRYIKKIHAESGAGGRGANCSGKDGVDSVVMVPVGTLVRSALTNELLGDLNTPGKRLRIARGGRGGKGNAHFRSSVQRAPRMSQPGEAGEGYDVLLELQVLADVGLLGLPNAGKSTLLRSISDAKPKVASYPFTTLWPHLGVVRMGPGKSFVVADIPGLIEGAAEGAGLGHQFLRHVRRTKLLLHLVDIAPIEERDPVQDVQVITEELRRFDPELMERERWLVINQIDKVSEDVRDEKIAEFLKELNWTGRYFVISGATKEGLTELCYALLPVVCPDQPKVVEAPVEADLHDDRDDRGDWYVAEDDDAEDASER